MAKTTTFMNVEIPLISDEMAKAAAWYKYLRWIKGISNVVSQDTIELKTMFLRPTKDVMSMMACNYILDILDEEVE